MLTQIKPISIEPGSEGKNCLSSDEHSPPSLIAARPTCSPDSCCQNYYARNRDKILAARAARYSGEDKGVLKLRAANYYSLNKDKVSERRAARYAQNKSERRQKAAEKRKANKEAINARQREYARANRDKITGYRIRRRAQTAAYRKANASKARVQAAEWRKRDCKAVVANKIASTLRCRIRTALRRAGAVRSEKTADLLGCSPAEFKAHIENLFQPGMTWENRGPRGWHIDHIKPCAAFDLSQPLEQKKCFHFSNLQPLWAVDNLRKSKSFSVTALPTQGTPT